MSELRRDPLSGRVVAIAPGRAARPGAASSALIEPVTESELADCPFCGGREDRTPPEVLRIGDPWQVRVVPNLYPAVERQEVVIHSPRHVRSFAELEDEELRAISLAWHERGEEAWVNGYAYVHSLINEGRAAGSSLAHSHSQLVWLKNDPPEIATERANLSGKPCQLCDLLASRETQALEIARSGPVVAIAHPAGRLPYEILIAGEHWGGQEGQDGGDFLISALKLVRDCVRRLRALEGPIAWNTWLHSSGHWHFELVPRLSILAGVELGAGIYINTLAPDEAASRLRNAR